MDFLSQLDLESLRLLFLHNFNVHVNNVEYMFAFMFILCFIGKIMCLFGLSVVPLKIQDLTARFLSCLHTYHWNRLQFFTLSTCMVVSLFRANLEKNSLLVALAIILPDLILLVMKPF